MVELQNKDPKTICSTLQIQQQYCYSLGKIGTGSTGGRNLSSCSDVSLASRKIPRSEDYTRNDNEASNL